jgi:Holliday junction resolvase hjc
MKPNGGQYRRGRHFEYVRMKYWRGKGYTVIRSAGSHGPFDLIAFRNHEVHFIQCKVLQSESTAQHLMGLWIASPPLEESEHYTQHIEIAIKNPVANQKPTIRICSV